jgi:hypothetical protein
MCAKPKSPVTKLYWYETFIVTGCPTVLGKFVPPRMQEVTPVRLSFFA